MGNATSISWTHRTWNPFQGCARVSPGCDNCYMFRDMRRYGKDPDTVVRSKPPTFNRPLVWEREQAAKLFTPEEMFSHPRQPLPGSLVFLASWSDVFIKEADEWRAEMWKIIRECPHLTFQILTKRHGRIRAHLPDDWGDGYPNVWLGVTAEDAEWWARRVNVLRDIPARTKFVSYEPAIGSLISPTWGNASAVGIDWVIIGGESAPGRPFDLSWAREALAICRRDGAAPWVKQLGSYPVAPWSGERGDTPDWTDRLVKLRDRAGAEPSEWPADLRVQEFPVIGTPR